MESLLKQPSQGLRTTECPLGCLWGRTNLGSSGTEVPFYEQNTNAPGWLCPPLVPLHLSKHKDSRR